jgi:RHS repeat-associated protein/uncharacterized repeat protein (TIGR01451 family)
MNINRRATGLSALLCASFAFVFYAAGVPASALTVGSAREPSVLVESQARTSAADNIFANGFEVAPVSAPQLTIVKTASSATLTVGTSASYTLKVTNTGTAPTTASATVSDTIPNGLTIGTLPAGCSAAGQAITCAIASGLATGASTSFVISVTPTAAAMPSVTNTASVIGGGDPSCPGGGNCSSSVGPTLVQTAPLCVPGQDLDNDGLFDTACITLDPVPDPVTIAPPIDTTVFTDFAGANGFLFTAPNPVQRGTDASKVDRKRLAVLRGRVLDENGAPLSGAIVRVLGGLEFGYTLSRADGRYDIAINGGGTVTLDFQMAGRTHAQRTTQATPWLGFALVQEVALIPYDSQATIVTSGSPNSQVARASLATDADGARQATVYFPAGVQAAMTKYDGTSLPLSSLTFRATEYTVGSSGPQHMTGTLPATSGYTYAVELSTDEAVQANAKTVNFSAPVAFYVENFLGFPIGGIVPTGYYDYKLGTWVPSDNGRVIKIIGITGGQAVLDVDGVGVAATSTELQGLGITTDELQRLALTYGTGQELWRISITHLTPWDANWPAGPPPGAVSPPDLNLDTDKTDDDPCKRSGSIVECENQTLGETIPIAGTPYALHYRSDRVPGRSKRAAVFTVSSGASLPSTLKRIEVTSIVAGKSEKAILPPSPNQTYSLSWDGMDAYGRQLRAGDTLSVTVTYVYGLVVYQSPAQAANAFALASDTGTLVGGSRSAGEIYLSKAATATLGSVKTHALGLGGWTITPQHTYDEVNSRILLGDGDAIDANTHLGERSAGQYAKYGYGGDGGPARQAMFSHLQDVAAMPDGSYLLADENNHRVRRVAVDGTVSTFLGTGIACNSSNPCYNPQNADIATLDIAYPTSIVPGPNNDLFIVDLYGILKITNDKATRYAFLNNYWSTAIGPDGSIYYSDCYHINKIPPGGGNAIVIAGIDTSTAYSGDGGLATQANICPEVLTVANDGSIYFSENLSPAIRRIRPDGIIERVAGVDPALCTADYSICDGYSGDGGPALNAQMHAPSALTVTRGGSIVFYDWGYFQGVVREIDQAGIIRTIAGVPQGPHCGNNLPLPSQCGDSLLARQYSISELAPNWGGMSELANGDLLLAGGNSGLVAKLHPVSAYRPDGSVLFPNRAGTELYQFDTQGRHIATIDAITAVTLNTFAYNAANQLVSISDTFGNTTTIERDGSGNPTSIDAPDGQHTTLTLDPNGYLASVTNPLSESYQMTYSADGLLKTFTEPNGPSYTSQFTYNELGQLTHDQNAASGFWDIARTTSANGRVITMTSAEGRETTYQVKDRPDGGEDTTITSADNSVQVRSKLTDGTTTLTQADGTLITTLDQPDPRFGTLVPLTKADVITPNGLHYQSQQTRDVALSTPGDPLSFNQISEKLTVNGRTYTDVYNATTQKLTLISPMGRTSIVTLDAKSSPIALQVPGFAELDYAYDPRGRLSGTSIGTAADERTTILGYDANGFVYSIQDALTEVILLDNDAVGRTHTQTLADLRQIGFGYGKDGNVTSIAPPGQTAHGFGYTLVDNASTYTPPTVAGISDPHTGYSYNLDQQLISVARPDGLSIAPFYNSVTGDLDHIDTPDGSYAYSWYLGGRLQSLSAPGGVQLNYTYDGSLLTSVSTNGPYSASVNYAYDNNFWLTHLNGGGQTVDYGYDDDGLLTSAAVGTTSLTLTQDPLSGLLSGTSLGQINDSWGYNEFAEPHTYSASVNGTAVLSATYIRDALGRISQKNETILGTTHSTVYTYEPSGRLATVSIDGQPSAAYSYDTNSNRATHTIEVASQLIGKTIPCLGTISAPETGTGLADAQDRMTSYGTCTYSYGANGELQSRLDSATSQTTTYTYDVLGNLRRVIQPDNTQIDYVIDGQGRRIGKKINGTLIRSFVYGNQLKPIAELDGNGNVISTFVYAERASVPSYMLKNGNVYRIVADHVGSPRLIIDVAAGTIAQRIDYDEWGNVVNDTNQGFQPFGFAGGIYDIDTGLIRFGARDYDSISGRWTAKDQASFYGGEANLYAYAGNNPVNFTDALGLWWTWGDPIDQGILDLATGFGDGFSALGFSPSRYIRNAWDVDGGVNKCSAAYGTGKFLGGLAQDSVVPAGRLGYMAETVKLGAEAQVARTAVAARNALKDKYRGPILDRMLSGWHQPSYETLSKNATDAQILAKVGNPNWGFNLAFMGLGGGKFAYDANKGIDCGCK